jgi:hypothetical protein
MRLASTSVALPGWFAAECNAGVGGARLADDSMLARHRQSTGLNLQVRSFLV